MKRSSLLVFGIATAATVFFIASCLKPPNYDAAPTITFKSISKTTVNEDSSGVSDSLQLVFSFTDGDGDLGAASDNDTTNNVFLTDSRDNSVKPYHMPRLTPEGSVKAISGDVTINIGSFACRPGFENDPFTYKIVVKDRAGHESNAVQSEQITIDCH